MARSNKMPTIILVILSISQVYLSHGNAPHEFLTSTGVAFESAIVVGSRLPLWPEYLTGETAANRVIKDYWQFGQTHFLSKPSHASEEFRPLLGGDRSCGWQAQADGRAAVIATLDRVDQGAALEAAA